MPLATVLPEIPDAFSPLETTKVYLYKSTTAFANPASPTRAEINAGVDVTNQLADWTIPPETAEFIDVPNLGNKFVPRTVGRITVGDVTMTFNLSKAGSDIRAHLNADKSGSGGPKATKGWLIVADAGDAAGALADLVPFEVGSMGKERAVDSNLRITATMSVRTRPLVDIALPA